MGCILCPILAYYIYCQHCVSKGVGWVVYIVSPTIFSYSTAVQFQCMPIGGTRGMHNIEEDMTECIILASFNRKTVHIFLFDILYDILMAHLNI